ncbi:TPA: NADH:flavin oxidoreductase/NADH oxidase [Serratia odorifera]|jgi:2,4-dienoyl-CoA reductase-like NADH-dependent reductase (Old Yellow Enzyme family)|uniref:NADH:flavin oxidoreductase/NADH oxidase n=1 Tax=Serratia odorifera TaxID=618 RepID=UPI0029E6744B|nr:NADH:flavin oxidoreductase/NADH oxidase [Serratia odorifera]
MPKLFDCFTLKDITLRNRIVASPMCQYQAENGFVNDWHRSHYSMLARGGVGLLIVEATAVSPEGRITPGDLGLWSDAHAEGLTSVATAIKQAGAVAGIQLGHAGRKAGCTPPWKGGTPLDRQDPQAWRPVAASALPYVLESDYVPRAMSLADIRKAVHDFRDAARRASDAGFEWLELHFAHGFLAQTFLSSKTNAREDQYGGALKNRARFMLEVVEAVKSVWPSHLPLTARLGVVEFDSCPEHSFAESLQVIRWLKTAGIDFVDVGLALSTPDEQVPWGPNFMVPYAERVRRETGIPVSTSWMITRASDASDFIQDVKLDLVFFARTLLTNPHWVFQAARELGIVAPESVLPQPYAYWLQNWAE